MSVLQRKLKTATKLFREQGLAGVTRFTLHRYKYPYLRAYLRWFPERTPLKRPHVVQIEVSSKCNLRCPSCSLTREITPARNMDPEELRLLLDKLPFRPDSVSLNGIGEALVNPGIFRIIDLLAERGIQASFYTNGTLLNERIRGEILRRPNVTFVGISCDGATKEVFEELRYGAKLEVWKENVRAFVSAVQARAPRPIMVNLNTVISRINRGELLQIIELAASLGFRHHQMTDLVPNDETSAAMALSAEESAEIDREGLIAHGARLGVEVAFTSLSKRPQPYLNCLQPWEYIQISVEGDILPCCAILGSDKAEVMGNLHHESFAEIWDGDRFRRFRGTAGRGTNPICNACPYY
jgi:radical SAM protein with 4Fe4S-binding SPASM domain